MTIVTNPDRRDTKYNNLGGGSSFKRDVAFYNSPHIKGLEEEFWGDSLDARWTVTHAGTSGASAVLNGKLTLTTGTDNDATAFITSGLAFSGDKNAVIETRLKISELEAIKVEVGFTDALADAGAINILATPSETAADCAIVIMDTDDTGPTDDPLQFLGAKASTNHTKLEPATVRFVADKYLTITVALRGDDVRYIVRADDADNNPNPYYDSGWIDNGIEGGTAVTPWIFAQTRDTDSVDLTVDYIHVWQSRV